MATPRNLTYSVGSGGSVYAGMTAPAPSVPAWLVGAALFQWVQIPNTIHMGSPADPTDTGGASSRSNARLAYSNIARDNGTRIIIAATGGHADYSGNEVTGIDLGVDAPTWSLLMARSTSVQQNVPYYADGKPTSRHGYWGVHYSTTRSRLMLHYTRFSYGTAVSFVNSNGFNLANNTWDPQGTWADAVGPALCNDSNDNAWAYASGGVQLWKWTAATDSWAQTGSFANQVCGPMAFDSARSQFFHLAWGDGQASGSGVSAYKYNAAGNTQTAITLNSIGGALAQFTADTGSYASMEYVVANDCYFWWDGVSRRLYKVVPNTGTTWDLSIQATTGTAPPQAESSFGRMVRIVTPNFSGLAFMPTGYTNLYFLRTA